MKIRLLNDGGYGDMNYVSFPVTVDAVRWGNGVRILGRNLIKRGAKNFNENEMYYFSLLEGEREVIEE